MIWKSNLNQFEQELIDDFGGKTTQLPVDDKPQASGVVKPAAHASRPSTAVVKSKQNSESKGPAAKSVVASASKKEIQPQMIKAPKSTLQEPFAPAVAETGISGSGEVLAQTLEKVVT